MKIKKNIILMPLIFTSHSAFCNTIEIKSCLDFQNIKNNPSSTFKVINDIDCSGFDFISIPSFSGVLDGDNHTIKNIQIKDIRSTLNHYTSAIFSQISGVSDQGKSIIKNLKIKGVSIKPNVNIPQEKGNKSLIISGLVGEGWGYSIIDNVQIDLQSHIDLENYNTKNNFMAGVTFGGILGITEGDNYGAEIKNTFVNLDVDFENMNKYQSTIGGMVGVGFSNISYSGVTGNIIVNGESSLSIGGLGDTVLNYDTLKPTPSLIYNSFVNDLNITAKASDLYISGFVNDIRGSVENSYVKGLNINADNINGEDGHTSIFSFSNYGTRDTIRNIYSEGNISSIDGNEISGDAGMISSRSGYTLSNSLDSTSMKAQNITTSSKQRNGNIKNAYYNKNNELIGNVITKNDTAVDESTFLKKEWFENVLHYSDENWQLTDGEYPLLLNENKEVMPFQSNINPDDNHVPTIMLNSNYQTQSGEIVTINSNASDLDGDNLTYHWNVPSDLTVISGVKDKDLIIQTNDKNIGKNFTISIEVSDGTSNASASTALKVNASEDICTDIPEFIQKQYGPNVQVTYEGNLYESTRWTDSTTKPTDEYSGWSLIGSCA